MVESRALSAQELLLLYLRYGCEYAPATQPQAAEELGLSLHTVCRMEREILRQLRLSRSDPLASGWNGWDEV